MNGITALTHLRLVRARVAVLHHNFKIHAKVTQQTTTITTTKIMWTSMYVQEIAKLNTMATSLLKQGDCRRARAILIKILLFLQEHGDSDDNDISESEDEDDEKMQEEEVTTGYSIFSKSLPNLIMDRTTTALEAQALVRSWLEVTGVHVVPSSIYNRTWQIPLGCTDTTQIAAVILFNLALIDHRAALFSNTVSEQTRILQDALRCYEEAHDLLQETDELLCDCFWVLLLRSALCFNMMHIYSTIGGSLSMSYLLMLELQTIQARLQPDSVHHQYHHHQSNHSSNPQDSQMDVDIDFLKHGFEGLRINI
jgi:hypothetical protein